MEKGLFLRRLTFKIEVIWALGIDTKNDGRLSIWKKSVTGFSKAHHFGALQPLVFGSVVESPSLNKFLNLNGLSLAKEHWLVHVKNEFPFTKTMTIDGLLTIKNRVLGNGP